MQAWEGQAKGLTVCVYSNDEVISHGLGLSQLVGVAVMDHVVAGRQKYKKNKHEYSQRFRYHSEAQYL